MSEQTYWIIDYTMTFLSDFHIGAGITLLGGNVHGLNLDSRGLPCMGHTEVRGLLRRNGYRLCEAYAEAWGNLQERWLNNFGKSDNSGKWSYTSARFDRFLGAAIGAQSHINRAEKRLFSYQKAGGDQQRCWQGKIYSIEPAAEEDVGFMVACMRMDDRIGQRRTRGYGKICWQPKSISRFQPGQKPDPHREQDGSEKKLSDWLRLGLGMREG